MSLKMAFMNSGVGQELFRRCQWIISKASKVSLDVVMPAIAWHKWSAELSKLSGGHAHAAASAVASATNSRTAEKHKRTEVNGGA